MDKILLEDRRCACGCGNIFRVMPASKQIYANEYCREFHLKIPRKEIMKQYYSGRKRGRPKKEVIETTS